MTSPYAAFRRERIARRLMDRASGFQCLAFQQGEAGGYAIFRRLSRGTRSGISRARLPAPGAANQTAEAD